MKLSIKVYREDILGDKKDVDGVAADLRHAKEYVEQPSDEHRLGRFMILMMIMMPLKMMVWMIDCDADADCC